MHSHIQAAMMRRDQPNMATLYSVQRPADVKRPYVDTGATKVSHGAWRKARNTALMMSFVFAVAGVCLGAGLTAADERRQEIESMSVSAPIYDRGDFEREKGR